MTQKSLSLFSRLVGEKAPHDCKGSKERPLANISDNDTTNSNGDQVTIAGNNIMTAGDNITTI